jgi:hypothetical protein
MPALPLTPGLTWHCTDGLTWLREHPAHGSIFTAVPDADEVGLSQTEWDAWYRDVVEAMLGSIAPGACGIWLQTDRRSDGQQWSKALPVLQAASQRRWPVLWHKVVMRGRMGYPDYARPTYSHLIAVGTPSTRPGKPSPDVLPQSGGLYKNGSGLAAARFAAHYALQRHPVLVDPFCGRGAHVGIGLVVHAGNAWPWEQRAEREDAKPRQDATLIGIDIDPMQIARAMGQWGGRCDDAAVLEASRQMHEQQAQRKQASRTRRG